MNFPAWSRDRKLQILVTTNRAKIPIKMTVRATRRRLLPLRDIDQPKPIFSDLTKVGIICAWTPQPQTAIVTKSKQPVYCSRALLLIGNRISRRDLDDFSLHSFCPIISVNLPAGRTKI